MTDLLIRPILLEESDTSNRCEDCPDVNPRPPSASECPYFEERTGFPVCTRDNKGNGSASRWYGMSQNRSGLGEIATAVFISNAEVGEA